MDNLFETSCLVRAIKFWIELICISPMENEFLELFKKKFPTKFPKFGLLKLIEFTPLWNGTRPDVKIM